MASPLRGIPPVAFALLLAACGGGGGGSDPGPQPECTSPADCPGADGECQSRTCTGGTCGVSLVDAGTVVATQTAGDCQQRQCDGAGNVTSVALDTDVPADDGRECTSEACSGGVPEHANLDAGVVASTQTAGDCQQRQCDGSGNAITVADDGDVPLDDGNQCTAEVCSGGVGSHPNLPLWTPCTQNGGNACTANGECIHSTDAQIAVVRAAPDGGGLSLPIVGATVSYVKPAIGGEPAGFTVQSYAAGGPAVFVAIDPATLVSVEPAPGDIVSFTVNAVATVNLLKRVTAIGGYERLGSGAPLPTAQDVSSDPNLVASIASFESELVTAVGTVAGAFSSSGAGMSAARFSTDGVPASASLQLRLVESQRAFVEVVPGCRVEIGPTPAWRFNANAQLCAWAFADFTALSCPAPRVTSAVALSATTVEVAFDRRIDPVSIFADGSQFTFDGGLAALAATASGTPDRTVHVTTTAQTPGTSYTVTVASTVRDLLASGVDAAASTATFAGYRVPAIVAISEINNVRPNGIDDLAELVVLSGGWGEGIVLNAGVVSPSRIGTLPAIELAPGDVILVHALSTSIPTIITETVSRDECTDPACHPGAWDVASGAGGIAISNTIRVLAVRSRFGTLLDAVPFTNGASPTGGTFENDLAEIQLQGLWLPADCGGERCTSLSTPTAEDVAVSWAGVDPAGVGSSVQWIPGTAGNQKADWTVAPHSFGLPNP